MARGGRFGLGLRALAIELGGHVRVGLEDNVYLDKGVLAQGSAPLVERLVNPATLRRYDYVMKHKGLFLAFLMFLIPGDPARMAALQRRESQVTSPHPARRLASRASTNSAPAAMPPQLRCISQPM